MHNGVLARTKHELYFRPRSQKQEDMWKAYLGHMDRESKHITGAWVLRDLGDSGQSAESAAESCEKNKRDPENWPSHKERIVFQPSIFRCYVRVIGLG